MNKELSIERDILDLVIKNDKQMINYIQYADFYMSQYNNSLAKIPQVLITTESLKSSVNNIRSGIKKLIRFIEREKDFDNLEQLYKSVNVQFIFLIEIIQIHFTKEYTVVHNEINNLNFSKLHMIFEQKNEQRFIRELEIKKKRLRAFIWRILTSHQLILKTAKSLNININQQDYLEIIKEISFPKEYNQIGINILNYFGETIHSKYPDKDISISIQQLKTKIILVIRTPEKDLEIIEKNLRDYGEVCLHQKPIEQYLTDDIQTKKLEHQLQLIELELDFTKQLLSTEKEKNTTFECFKHELKNATFNIENLHMGDKSMVISNNTNTNIIGNNTGDNSLINAENIEINTPHAIKSVEELISNLNNILEKDNIDNEESKSINNLKNHLELTSKELNLEEPNKQKVVTYWKSIKDTIKTFSDLSTYGRNIIKGINIIESSLKNFL